MRTGNSENLKIKSNLSTRTGSVVLIKTLETNP